MTFTALEAAALDSWLTDPPESPDVCCGCGGEFAPYSLGLDDNLDPWCDDCWEVAWPSR